MLKHVGTKKSNTRKIAIQLKEINKKVREKEGRLKRYKQGVNNTVKMEHSETTKENSTHKLGGDDTKTYQQPDSRETEQF